MGVRCHVRCEKLNDAERRKMLVEYDLLPRHERTGQIVYGSVKDLARKWGVSEWTLRNVIKRRRNA